MISAFKTKINHPFKARKEPFKELRMEMIMKKDPSFSPAPKGEIREKSKPLFSIYQNRPPNLSLPNPHRPRLR
jgi:hypothetical protein